jgi:hypothetical protein
MCEISVFLEGLRGVGGCPLQAVLWEPEAAMAHVGEKEGAWHVGKEPELKTVKKWPKEKSLVVR